jgi:hypothetical protein
MAVQWKRFHQTLRAKFGWVVSIIGATKWLADWWGRGEVVREWVQHLPHSLQFLNEPWVVPLTIIVGLGMVFWAGLDRGGSVGFDNIRWLPETYRRKKVPHEYFVGAVVIVAVMITGALLHNRSGRKEVVIAPSGQHETKQLPSHTLLVRFEQSVLPVRVAPHDTAYILQLNPEILGWAWEVPNDGTKAIAWPADIHPKKGKPPGDFIYACVLTNDEDKTLLDVSIPFEVSFHELEMVPVIVTTHKDGTQSITFPRPGSDHIIVTLGHPRDAKDSKAARDGEVIKKFTHSVSLPSVHPGSTARIYLVNQSKFISKFTFPAEASAIVAGNSERIRVALIRPNVTIMDTIPWFGLAPSTYHWEGVPDAP